MILDTKKYTLEPSKKSIQSLEDKTDNRVERQKIYSTSKWQKIRKQKMFDCPICECCGSALSEHVHHSDSFMNYTGFKRWEKAFDYDNLEALCQICHTKKHKILNKFD